MIFINPDSVKNISLGNFPANMKFQMNVDWQTLFTFN